jgi:hypothetical protein
MQAPTRKGHVEAVFASDIEKLLKKLNKVRASVTSLPAA